MLYERGWKKRRTQDLFHILDWLLYMPEYLSERLQHEIIERLALAKGQAIGELAEIGDVAAFMA